MNDNVCKIDGCIRPLRVKSHQLCNVHYIRFRTFGDPLAGGEERGLPEKWILDHLNSDSDECLFWPFSVNDHGYGRIRYQGREWVASRLMCKLRHGDPPSAKHEAAHSCGNGHLGCTNPNHLRWATSADNEADKVDHGTSNRGARNGHAKLDEESVRVALSMKSSGALQRDIARHLGVSEMTISDLLNGHLWSWLTGIPPKKRGVGRATSHANDNSLPVAANDNEARRAAA